MTRRTVSPIVAGCHNLDPASRTLHLVGRGSLPPEMIAPACHRRPEVQRLAATNATTGLSTCAATERSGLLLRRAPDLPIMTIARSRVGWNSSSQSMKLYVDRIAVRCPRR